MHENMCEYVNYLRNAHSVPFVHLLRSGWSSKCPLDYFLLTGHQGSILGPIRRAFGATRTVAPAPDLPVARRTLEPQDWNAAPWKSGGSCTLCAGYVARAWFTVPQKEGSGFVTEPIVGHRDRGT